MRLPESFDHWNREWISSSKPQQTFEPLCFARTEFPTSKGFHQSRQTSLASPYNSHIVCLLSLCKEVTFSKGLSDTRKHYGTNTAVRHSVLNMWTLISLELPESQAQLRSSGSKEALNPKVLVACLHFQTNFKPPLLFQEKMTQQKHLPKKAQTSSWTLTPYFIPSFH